MSVRTYNPSVRVGNWNEDIQLEEDTLKDFLQKRENGELHYQKRSKLEQSIFKPVELSVTQDGCVHYGDKVQIKCCASTDQTRHFAHKEPRQDCVLAVLPEMSNMLYSQKFEGPCKVAGYRQCDANLRSTFVIKSLDGGMEGKALRYGDKFNICTLEGEGGNLFLQSDKVSLHKSPNKSRHQEVKLTDQVTPHTQWQVLYFNPRLRLEYEGTPVAANEKVIINHVISNQDLAVEEKFCTRTPFGSLEYEISSNTYLNTHKAEEDVNHWMFVTGKPGPDIHPGLNQSQTLGSTNTTSS